MTGVAGVATVWRRSDRIVTRRTPRSIVIATHDLADPRALTGVALAVWDQLEQHADDDGLVDRVAARLGIGVERVRDEVIAIRESLCHAGAVVACR